MGQIKNVFFTSMQINTDIYVLRKEHVTRLVERYPIIRSQIMVIAEHRYRLAKLREAATATSDLVHVTAADDAATFAVASNNNHNNNI